jgi:deoxyribonuclease V
MRPVHDHPWDLPYRDAVALQATLRSRLVLAGGPRSPKLVAGVDASFVRMRGRSACYAAVVVLRFPDAVVVEEAFAAGETAYPYIPGLLSFREGPIVLQALAEVRREPDVLMFDGQGVCHPRGFGLASHLGYLLDRPTIGCAKSLLVGGHGPLGADAGSTVPLLVDGKTVGAAVRTRTGVHPVYVSPGHRTSLDRAVAIVRATTRGYRLPEPTRLAHQAVTRFRKEREDT